MALGVTYAATSRFDDAVDQFKTALTMRKDHPETLHRLGAALLSLDRKDEAIEVLLRAVKVKPDHPDGYYNLGLAYRRIDRPDEAIKAFQQGIRLQPNNPVLHAALGSVLLEIERFQDAVDAYEQAVWLDPNDMDSQRNHGIALERLGRGGRGPWRACAGRRQEPRRRPGALLPGPRPGARTALGGRLDYFRQPSSAGPTTPRRTTTSG
nr:tetratricopeptide repeat protein [Deltaproteobacteria bacterium]